MSCLLCHQLDLKYINYKQYKANNIIDMNGNYKQYVFHNVICITLSQYDHVKRTVLLIFCIYLEFFVVFLYDDNDN